MFLLFLQSMLIMTLCTSSLSRPLSVPSIVNVPRAYSPNDPNLPPAVKTVCEAGISATTVASSTPFSSGVVLTTGSCTPANTGVDDSVDLPVALPSCPVPANNCGSRFGTEYEGASTVAECGAPCSSTCYPGSDGPDPNDCAYIVSALTSQSPQLFTVAPYDYILLTYQSCGIGFQNQMAPSSVGSCPQTIIYDYQDVAAISNYLAWNCQAAQGARGGVCRANSGLYQPSVPDFYIQVYQNA